MDPLATLDVASAGFARTLALVEPGDWTLPSPNPGWTVRDLVNHVVGGNHRYTLLLTGAPTDQVEALRDLDHLGEDPYDDFVTSAAECAASFRAPGALEAAVHHRHGDRYGAELLVMRIAEHALHGWDLATAIGQEASLDPPVVEVLLDAVEVDPAFFGAPGYAPATVSKRLTGAARLLALTSRR